MPKKQKRQTLPGEAQEPKRASEMEALFLGCGGKRGGPLHCCVAARVAARVSVFWRASQMDYTGASGDSDSVRPGTQHGSHKKNPNPCSFFIFGAVVVESRRNFRRSFGHLFFRDQQGSTLLLRPRGPLCKLPPTGRSVPVAARLGSPMNPGSSFDYSSLPSLTTITTAMTIIPAIPVTTMTSH